MRMRRPARSTRSTDPVEHKPLWHRLHPDWVVAAVAVITLIVLIGGSILSTAEEAGDGIRDRFRSPASLLADNVRERLPHRGFWVGERDRPSLIDESLDYIGSGRDADPSHLAGDQILEYSLEQVVHEAFALRAKPIRFVAKVLERDATDEPDDGITVELRLVARKNRAVEIRAGLSPGVQTKAEIGDIVVIHGLVVAKGDVQRAGERERVGAYVVVDEITHRHAWRDIEICPIPRRPA